MQHRHGEAENSHPESSYPESSYPGNTYPRTDRYYRIGGEWFFSTREKLQIGPFNNRDEAEAELMSFLRHRDEGGIYIERYILQQRRWSNNLHWN